MFLMAFVVQEMVVGWIQVACKTVPGQIFVSVNFRSLGFIHEYSEYLYTVKITINPTFLVQCSIFESATPTIYRPLLTTLEELVDLFESPTMVLLLPGLNLQDSKSKFRRLVSRWRIFVTHRPSQWQSLKMPRGAF